MEEDESGEKTEEPSQYRLEEFRSKGQVASSRELTSVLVLSACIMTLIFSSAYVFELFSDFFRWILTQDVTQIYNSEKFKVLILKSITLFVKCIIPVVLTSLSISIFSTVMQIGFIFSPDVLSLKWERINPLEGLKRLISKKALFDTGKGLIKFIVIISITYNYLKNHIGTLNGYFYRTAVESFSHGEDLMVDLSFLVILGLGIIALFDFAWEKYQYRQKLLLTRQKAKEELKEKEGNPEVKQRIRMLQREMATKRMMSDVPNADVVISNPTHISVAIKYDNNDMIAPVVLAKGADDVALRIRKIATEHDIPIVENIPLARTLYKTVKIGHMIPRTLYKAVADILTYVYRLKNKNYGKKIKG